MPPTTRKNAAPRKPSAVTKNGQTGRTIEIPNQMLRMPDDSMTLVEVPIEDIPRFYSTPTEPDQVSPYDERETVFFYDNKEFTAPVTVPASHGLKFTEMRTIYGIDHAVLYAIQDTLGMEGFNVLTQIPNLSSEQLDAIVSKLVMKLVNSTALPKGR